MIDTIFLAYTAVVPPEFFYLVVVFMLIHAGFFTIINRWL